MDITNFITDVVKADEDDLADIDKLDFSDLDIDVEEVVNWLEKKYGDEDLEDIGSVWLDGGITGDNSFVDNPAQWSEILAFKDERDRKNLETGTPIKSAEKDFDFTDEDDDRMMTIAPILVPKVDKEGELIPPQLTEKMIDDYMENIEDRQNNVSFDHDGNSGKGEVARVWTTLEEREFENVEGETVTYPESTAIFGIKHNSELDEQTVKNGDIEGLSMEGYKIPVDPEELRKKLKDSQAENKSMSEKSEEVEGEKEDSQELSIDKISDMTEKEINANDLIGLLADFMDVETSEVSEALDPLMNGEDAEESEKDTDDEQVEDETESKSVDIDFEDVEAIQELQKEVEDLKSKLESSEEVEDEQKEDDDDDDEDEEDEEEYEDKEKSEESEKDTDDEQVEDEQKEDSQETEKAQTEKSEDPIDKVFGRQGTETQKSANDIEDDDSTEKQDAEKSEASEDGTEQKDQSDDPIDEVF